jgi:hypothetical protein
LTSTRSLPQSNVTQCSACLRPAPGGAPPGRCCEGRWTLSVRGCVVRHAVPPPGAHVAMVEQVAPTVAVATAVHVGGHTVPLTMLPPRMRLKEEAKLLLMAVTHALPTPPAAGSPLRCALYNKPSTPVGA